MFELPSAPDVSYEDAPCGSHSLNARKISSKFGHGGPRENSGGARPNSGGRRRGAGRPRKEEPEQRIIASLPPEMWSGPRWVVYQTFPQAERLAAHELTREGYRTYLPLIADRRRDPVIKSMWHRILVPRFVGYSFVELGPTDPWLPVKNTSGVSSVLLIGGKPAPVPSGEVEKHMADDGELCNLAREELPELEAGTSVKIEAGAYTGNSGIVISCNGLVTVIEVEAFGRPVPAKIARSMVVQL